MTESVGCGSAGSQALTGIERSGTGQIIEWRQQKPIAGARIEIWQASTRIVTRALHKGAPQAQSVATDVNPAMLAIAAQKLRSDRASFQPASEAVLHSR
jgi:hypothetical protein